MYCRYLFSGILYFSRDFINLVFLIEYLNQHNKYLTNPKLKIIIPLTLKEWLIDDLDAIMQQNKVNKILNFRNKQIFLIF